MNNQEIRKDSCHIFETAGIGKDGAILLTTIITVTVKEHAWIRKDLNYHK